MNSKIEAAEIIKLIKRYEEGKLNQDFIAIKIGEYVKKYGTPIIHENIVVFVYIGFASKVNVIGDWNGWNLNADPMTRIGITPVFYLVKNFPLDARLEYKFVVDRKRILDPLNSLRSENGVSSEIRMPDYKPPEFLSSNIMEVYGMRGKLKNISSFFEARRVYVYTPPGYEYSTIDYPLLIVNDGTGYLKRARICDLLDYAILKGEIVPVLAVLVDAHSKKEYMMDEEYARFLASEIIPHMLSNYRVNRKKICTIGASLGGLTSLFLSLSYPDIFGYAISQSGLFLKKNEFLRLGFNPERDVFDILVEYRGSSLKVFLECGTYEHVLGIDVAERNEELYNELLLKGFKVDKLKINQGHNWTNWRDSLLSALKRFFQPK